jgi:nucleoside-diphosphate-sugar epimerase
MNILVIGGTGFISGSLVRHLRAHGDRVTVVARGESGGVADSAVEILRADRTDPQALERAVGGRMFDAVYDMIAYRPEQSVEAARLFRGKTGRFIHCSTVSVYMVSDEVTCPITEDQDRRPLMEFRERNPFGMEYGILKRKCEEVLWQAHHDRDFPVTMLRPTYVSGPHDPARRDFFWIERILDGGPLLIPGTGEYRFQQVFVEDVGRLFAGIAHLPRTAGEAYNVAGEETFTTKEYLRALGMLLNRMPDIVHIPQAEFDAHPVSSSSSGDVFPFNPGRDAVVSLQKTVKDTAYRSTPFDDWMGETIRWWQSGSHGHSNGYERRPEELALIRSRLH